MLGAVGLPLLHTYNSVATEITELDYSTGFSS